MSNMFKRTVVYMLALALLFSNVSFADVAETAKKVTMEASSNKVPSKTVEASSNKVPSKTVEVVSGPATKVNTTEPKEGVLRDKEEEFLADYGISMAEFEEYKALAVEAGFDYSEEKLKTMISGLGKPELSELKSSISDGYFLDFSNIDNLYIPYPEEDVLDDYKSNALPFTRALFSTFSAPVVTNSTKDKAGELSINKEAKKVDGSNDLFNIELTVSGKDKEATTDILLLLDKSGSMGAGYGSGNRMANAKSAINTFIDTVIPESGKGNVQVGLIAFNTETISTDLSNDVTHLKGELAKIKAGGNTFTHKALKEAKDILAGSKATNRIIVVLSDGIPSATYKLESWDWDYNEWQNSAYRDLIKKLDPPASIYTGDVPDNNYIITDKIDLSLVDYDGGTHSMSDTSAGTYSRGAYDYKDEIYIVMSWDAKNNFHSYLNLNNLYKAESRSIREDGIELYAVGLEMNKLGQGIMEAIGGDKNTYKSTVSGLDSVYSKIASDVSYAATDAVITDPMGEMFSIVAKDAIKVVDKDGNKIENKTKEVVMWDESKETITINLDKVTEAMSPIKISYQVRLDGPNPVAGEMYNTNKETTIEYTDADGNKADMNFPIPKGSIDAAQILSTYVLVDKDGNLLKLNGSKAMDFNQARIDTKTSPAELGTAIEVEAPELFEKDGVKYIRKHHASAYGYDKNNHRVIYTAADGIQDSPAAVNTISNKNPEVVFTYEKAINYRVEHIYDKDGDTILLTEEEGLSGLFGEEKTAFASDEAKKMGYTPKKLRETISLGAGENVIRLYYTKNEVTFTANSDRDVVYDGNPHNIAEDGYKSSVTTVTFAAVKVKPVNAVALGEHEVGFENDPAKLVIGSDGKYYFPTYKSGVLEIKQAPSNALGLSAKGYNGVYDGKTHKAEEIKVKEGATLEYRVAGGAWSKEEPSITNVGTIEVEVRANKAGYVEAKTKYTLNVTPKVVVVKADNKSKLEGEKDPELTATISGLIEGEAKSLIEYKLEREAGNEVNKPYPIRFIDKKEEQGNYKVRYENAILTISAKGNGDGTVDPDPAPDPDPTPDPEPELPDDPTPGGGDIVPIDTTEANTEVISDEVVPEAPVDKETKVEIIDEVDGELEAEEDIPDGEIPQTGGIPMGIYLGLGGGLVGLGLMLTMKKKEE